MVKFILSFARHGESTYNKQKLVQGQSNPPLSEDGVLQAECLSNRLVDEKIDYVYTSDLLRATQTADIILKSLRTSPRDVIKEKGLRERSFGDKEGLVISEYRAYLQREGYTFRTHVPEGGESFDFARTRIVGVFHDIICQKQLEEDSTTSSNGNLNHVLIVGHGLLFKELLAYFIDDLNVEIPGGKDRVMKDSPNCNLSRFEVESAPDVAPKITCQFIYDYSHFTEEMQKAVPSKAY